MKALPAALALAACSALPGQQRPHLDQAREVARWLTSVAVETPNGLDWPQIPADDPRSGTDLYNGMPGVILFFLELAHATGEQAHLDTARRGADQLLSRLGEVQQAGLYTGLAGTAFTLELVHRATGEDRYAEAVQTCSARIRELARGGEGGVQWNGVTDIISGSAGIGLYLLWEAEHRDDPAALALAQRAGDWLVQAATELEDGSKWAMAGNNPRLYPNFSHGTGGVAYFLARLATTTGEERYRDAALAGGRYLLSVANDDGLVFHHEPEGEDLYYLGWCHGPPGTALLYEELAKSTGEHSWADAATRSAAALLHSGIPEQPQPGFWNNVGQCCGSAGVGEFFLRLYQSDARDDYLEFCERITADLVDRADASGEGLRWVQAEHRVQPDLLQAQTGLMQGSAGIGLWLLHLDGQSARRDPLVVLPDRAAW